MLAVALLKEAMGFDAFGYGIAFVFIFFIFYLILEIFRIGWRARND